MEEIPFYSAMIKCKMNANVNKHLIEWNKGVRTHSHGLFKPDYLSVFFRKKQKKNGEKIVQSCWKEL